MVAINRWIFGAGACGLLACNGADSVSGGEPLPLSDLAADGGDVVIASDQSVWIDGDVSMGVLTVNGRLTCKPGVNAIVELEGLGVVGEEAIFECGTPDERFEGSLTILLTGERDLAQAIPAMGHDVGERGVVVTMGATLSLYGDLDRSAPARLDGSVEAGATELALDTSVQWQPGDTVVVTSTGFDRRNIEQRAVVASEGNALQLDAPLDAAHFGEIQQYDDVADAESYTLDERAYVVNLTRSIRLVADDDAKSAEQIGGHLMLMMGGKAYVDGVEIQRFGQMGRLGRYPFHWHIQGDVDGQFLRNSSVHESFNRCVVIHSTHGAEVDGNVCFDHFGHGFFLEEGHEQRNVITNNIGIRSKKVAQDRALLSTEFNTMPADRFPGPATYWIPHPNNTITDNVAIGSEGSGFWMAFRDRLVCDSVGCNPPKAGETPNEFPRTSDTLAFDRNIAVSCVTGITWDGAADGDVIDNPLNPGKDFTIVSSHYAPPTVPVFDGLVAYKNSAAGLYFRGEQVIYRNAILADNGTNGWYAYNQVVQDSLIVGASASMTADDLMFHANPPAGTQGQEVHRRRFDGIRIYDGPFVLDNVYFAGYPGTKVVAAGIDFTPLPIQMVGGAERWVNWVQRVTFETESSERVTMAHDTNQWQDSYSAAIRDVDGDLTGVTGALLRPRHPMNDHPSCEEWGADMYLCDYAMGHIRVNVLGLGNKQDFSVQRSDGGGFVPADNGDLNNKFPVIVGEDQVYTLLGLNANNRQVFELRFTSDNVNDRSPVIRLKNPKNLPCAVTDLRVQSATEVASLAQVRSSSESTYAFDGGDLVFTLVASDTKPNMWPGTAQGTVFQSIGCD